MFVKKCMITIREIEDKDLIPLAEYLPNGFPNIKQKTWLEKFEYWWTTNPAYSDHIPRGWLLEQNGAIVGFLGNIPVNIMVQGEVKPAAAANSWYLEPSVRGIHSVRLFNEFMRQKNISVFLFKSYNENFKKFLSRYNFKEYILPKSQQEFIYIIDKKKLNPYSIAFILFNDVDLNFQGVAELSRRVVFLIGSWIFQKSLVQGEHGADEVYTSSTCTSCDGSFLSIRLINQGNTDIEIFYDVKTLNWLYFSNRGTNQRIVIQCKRSSDNSLAGYAVFDMVLKDQYGKRILQLMDICIENENLQVLKSLIAYAIEIGKQNNIKLMIVWTNSPDIDAYLWKAGVLKRSVQNYRYIRFSDSDDMSSLNKDSRNVYSSLIFPPQ